MRGHLRTGVVIGLTVALMAFFLRSADLASVWSEIRRARLGLVLISLVAITVSYVARILRWQRLLAPLGAVGFGPAAHATVIGFATTSVLPGRLGEVVRPFLLARSERLSASAALGTIVMERLFDLITLVLLLGAFLLFFSGSLQQTDEQVLAALKLGGLIAAVGAATALALVVVAAREPHRVTDMAASLERVLPARFGPSVSRFLGSFSVGLGVAGQPGRLVRVLAWSFPVWLSVSASAWCVCQAFGIALPPSGSLLLVVLMALGVAVPTPAGVGSFHAAVQIGLTGFYGAPVDAAVGAALVLHAVSFGPVTVLGIYWMAHQGLTLRGAVALASSGAADGGEDATVAPPGASAPSSTGPAARQTAPSKR
jgi:hypothetical protein